MKAITKQIIRDVQSSLDEMDIEGMVERVVSSKQVNEYVERWVKDKLAEIIQEKAFSKIQKQMPLIDAWTDNKVTGFLMELGVR